MRLLGSAAFADPVNFRFMPVILAQKLSLREPPSGCGRLISCPAARRDARPFSFSPPEGDLPSDLCHAGDFAMMPSQTNGGSKAPAVFLQNRQTSVVRGFAARCSRRCRRENTATRLAGRAITFCGFRHDFLRSLAATLEAVCLFFCFMNC